MDILKYNLRRGSAPEQRCICCGDVEALIKFLARAVICANYQSTSSTGWLSILSTLLYCLYFQISMRRTLANTAPEGLQFCPFCTDFIPVHHYEIHTLVCRSRQISQAEAESEPLLKSPSNTSNRQHIIIGSQTSSVRPNKSNANSSSKSNRAEQKIKRQQEYKSGAFQKSKPEEGNQLGTSEQLQAQDQEQKSNLPQPSILGQASEQSLLLIVEDQQQPLEVQSLPEFPVADPPLADERSEEDSVVFPALEDFHNLIALRSLLTQNRHLQRLQQLIEALAIYIGGGRIEEGLSEEQIQQIHRQPFQLNEESMCPICQCNFIRGQMMMILGCGHRFHKDCLQTWLKINTKCPTCRWDVQSPQGKNQSQGGEGGDQSDGGGYYYSVINFSLSFH